MPFPKLSPLQSRLAASLVASIIVFVLYLTLSSSHFAYASEIESINPEDHNHERLLSSYILHGEVDDLEEQEVRYEAEFFGTDRGIVGRTDTGPQHTELLNNAPQRVEVIPGGSTVYFFVQNSTLSGKPSGDQAGLPSPVRLLLRTENQIEEPPRIQNLGSEEKIPNEEGTGNTVLHSRQTRPTTLYISLNTCQQPSDPTDIGGTKGAPPPLQLYVSQSSVNTLPGPDQSADTQQRILVVGGFANVTLQASGTVYIGVAAPSRSTFTEGNYTVEIAASIDAPFHSHIANSSDLYLIDSDMTSALLVTKNLGNSTNGTLFDEWMNLKPPFSIFVANTNRTFIAGVQNSYCGLKMYANIAGVPGGAHSNEVQTSMSNSTGSPYPKQQFLVQGLNGSSSYYGILAMTGNSTGFGAGVIGGGGRVWQSTVFQTQAGGNCILIYNLSFCNSVDYTVPGNPNVFPNASALGQWYDDQARAAYVNFKYALQQIPCEIEAEGAYSLARNCDDCAAAYKKWLCSVMIPRCVDYSTINPLLQERNIFAPFPNGTKLDSSLLIPSNNVSYMNSSRNPNIDTFVMPGPYKELLPCDDLCYSVVQSCPAAMGFSCPLPSTLGFNRSYGQRPQPGQQGDLTCNFPGAMRDAQNTGYAMSVTYPWVIVASLVMFFLLT